MILISLLHSIQEQHLNFVGSREIDFVELRFVSISSAELLYNIPDDFGEQAEIIIIPVNKHEDENLISSYNIMKLQEQNGSVSMLNEPEEDVWNDL